MLRAVGSSIRSARQQLVHGQLRSSSAALLSTKAASSGDDSSPIVLGCVSYDPSVGEIWSGIQDYLVEERKVPFRYQLFDSYEEQVESLVHARTIDVAWNGPVAHVLTEMEASKMDQGVVSLGMRDVDQDFESIVVIRKDSNITCLGHLQNRHLLQGSKDSPQACMVPYWYLTRELDITFAKTTQFDVDVGKHGDTAIGEIQAMAALIQGATTTSSEPPPQLATVSRMMWDRGLAGALAPQIDPERLKETCMELTTVPLPRFDHCQFGALLPEDDDKKTKLNDFGQAILEMDWNIPRHQHLMKLEGIQKQWKLPRQGGYNIVRKAMMGGNVVAKYKQASNFAYQKRSFSSSTTGNNSKPKTICVVGAGVSGLQALRALKAKGFDVTAYDASSNVGGLWQSNYSNFGVQVPKQLYEFQDFPMTQVPWGEYASGPQVQEYIEQYAKAFGLNDSIQCSTKVTCATQQSDGQSWKITTESIADGSSQTKEFDYLVVATGLYSNGKTYIPNKPGQEHFRGEIIHSSRFTDAKVAQGKNVVVIGSGKSAVDCAIEATKKGAESVTLLQRTAHWPTPQKIAGVIPFQYIFLSRFGTALVSTHRGTYPGSGMAVNAFRNSIIGPLLMKPVFRVVEELFAFQFGLRGDLRPQNDVVTDFYDVALVLDSELKQLRDEGKLNVRMGEIDSYGSDGNSVTLKDGSSLPADMIISATGFSPDFSFLDEATLRDLNQQKDGLYLYRYILPEKVPNLAFIGNVGAISNISSYGLQSEWLARLLSGTLQDNGAASSPDEMSAEIEARKAWARSWIPESPNRGNLVLLHQTHYHDQLCKDMAVNPHRKSNPIAEYLMPYEPADYDGIMGGKA
jgi:cation diffusion facilitator CzcD-associated flavoprotein CzcO